MKKLFFIPIIIFSFTTNASIRLATNPSADQITETRKDAVVPYTVLAANLPSSDPIPAEYITMLHSEDAQLTKVPAASIPFVVQVPVEKYEWPTGQPEKGKGKRQNQSRCVELNQYDRIPTLVVYGRGWRLNGFEYANRPEDLKIDSSSVAEVQESE